MGATVGLVAAPAFAWGMWYDAGCGASAIVMSVTAGTSLLVGIIGAIAPPFAILISTAVYVGLSIAVGVRTRTRRDRASGGACPKCAYSLVGLPGPVCPECGATIPAKR